MSNIAVKGATTGTGTFTLESPATNTDRTLVLPDAAGTVLTSAGGTVTGPLVVDTGYQQGLRLLRNYDVSQSVAGQALQFGAKLNGTPVYPVELHGVVDTDGTAYSFTVVQDGTTHLNIDSAGRVTMPYQPCFSVKENTASAYTNGQYAKLDSIQVNVGGGYNASTGLFTAPVAGNYLITSQLMTTSGTGRAIYYLYKNGSAYMEASSASTDYNDAQATTIMYLSAGDTCGIVVGSGTFYPYSGIQNFFCGHLIG
jgi:hypothetical protein